MIWGSAEEGNYYRAVTSITSTFTEREELFSRGLILLEECKRTESAESARHWRVMDEYYIYDREYIYYMNNL